MLNTVVWTITLEWNNIIPESFDFDTIASLTKEWNKVLYIFGETEIKTSKEFVEYCEKELGKITHTDISISSEDNILLEPYDYEEWVYEVSSFEWEQVSFSEIKNRFEESDSFVSIRECEVSKRFWNKIIRVDFVY
jgi:hypothetical protein